MTKRKKFIIISVLLSLGFIGIQLLGDQYRFISIGALGFFSLVLFFWALKDNLGLNATLLTLILPVFFTVGVGLFWFLLPASVYARIPVVLFYGLGIYSLCLTLNIYSVAAIRTIALLRAARGVGFILTLITFFLVYDTILSLRASVYVNSIAVFLVSIPLYLQAYWSIPLDKRISAEEVKLTITSSFIMAQVAIALFFWPVTIVVGSLFLTATVYVLLGLGQAKLEGRLFPQTVREYFYVGIAVFLGMFFATRWGG
jgi:hypothetical protein